MGWISDAANAIGRGVKKIWDFTVKFVKETAKTILKIVVAAALLTVALILFIKEKLGELYDEIMNNSDIETYLINPSFRDNTGVLTDELKDLFLRFLNEARIRNREGKLDIPIYNAGLKDGSIRVDEFYIIVNYDSYYEKVTTLNMLRINDASSDEGLEIRRRLRDYPILKVS